MPELRIRRISVDDPAVGDYVRVLAGAIPEDPESEESLRWAARTYPGSHLLLASRDGRPVGCATTGRVYVHPPAYERYWLTLAVVEGERGQGIGTALYAAASAIAREAGKRGFDTHVFSTHDDARRFLLGRGFVATETMRTVALDLTHAILPAVSVPGGIRITSLADRPDLRPALYEVALETFPDIPTGGDPIDPGSREEFDAYLQRPGAVPGATTVALDPEGAVVGYAQISCVPGTRTAAWHEMTTVRRAWRGRGIATALKAVGIAAAAAAGIERLVTANDEENVPMRAINRHLGYEPAADLISYSGPLADRADLPR